MEKNRESDVKMRITTQASCVDDAGVIWLFSEDYNALFSWESGNLKYVTTFEDEDFFESVLYNKALNYGDDIFFFPVRAKKIACYAKTEKQVTYVEIPERKENEYFNVIRENESQVWLFPVEKGDYAYIFDVEKKSIAKYTIPRKDINLCEETCVIGDALFGEYAYLAVSWTSSILKLNIRRCEYERLEVEEAVCKAHTFGNELYLLSASGEKVFRYSDGRLTTIWSHPYINAEIKATKTSEMEYAEFFLVSSGNMLLLPMKREGVYLTTKDGDKVIPIGEGGCQLYANILTFGETVYLMPYDADEMIILNSATLDFSIIKMNIRQDEYREIMIGEIKKKGKFYWTKV